MIRKPISARTRLLLGAASVVVLLAAYTLIAHLQHVRNPRDTTIPTWGQLARGVVRMCAASERSGERWITADAAATASRLGLGLGCGVLGAVILGVLMGCFPCIEAVLAPPLSLFAKMPPTAMLAVFFVLVGTGVEMYIAMIVFGILPTMAQSIHLAVAQVPAELLHKAYTLGASSTAVIWNVILRQILPRLLDGIRLQIGPAMVFLIAAEMVCADVGFGYRIRLQSRLLQMNVVYPYLACLALFGFAVDLGLRRLGRALCPWDTP